MCWDQAIEPPTQKARKYVIVIKILTLIQFVISVLNIVTTYFVRQGILGIIMMVLLVSAFRKLSHQSLMSYTFISLFFTVTFLVYVMTEVQRGTNISHVNHQSQFIFSVACVTAGFYFFVSIFCFFPYKEFKTIEFATNSGLQQFMSSNPTIPGKVSEQPEYQLPDEQFQGTARKREQGTFQAFKGQGIKIG